MEFIKKFIPDAVLKFIRPMYHGFLALFASWYFGKPSEKMIVIGVTGTNGKTTTVNLIAKILQEAGFKVGFTSTATLNINGQEILNPNKITMPSGWRLQKWLKAMLDRGCQYAVLEVSSEGLMQNRHLGINFDIAVFTNLTPEHLEAHNGFENYKRAKGKLFKELGVSLPADKAGNKEIGGKRIIRTIITNADDEHSEYFAKFKADKYITYGVKNKADYQALEVSYSPQGIKFMIHDSSFMLHLKGQFDVYNSLAAIAAAQSQNISLDVCKKALEKVEVVPGRVEVIQSVPFTVVVDYAYEPEEMRQLYETLGRWPHNRIIQVLGPTGGGRDKARIPILGKMAGKFADIMIVTMDDPYGEDPNILADAMLAGVSPSGEVRGQTLFKILDRRAAIIKALQLAATGDLVLITGKGAEQTMAVGKEKYIPWDDRKVVREELGFMFLDRHKNMDHYKAHDFDN